MLLTVISIILVSGLLCFVFYNQFSQRIQDDLQNRTDIFKNIDAQTAMRELTVFKSTDMRVTLIDPDGAVEYDNTVGAEGLQNHLDREEVREALEFGLGESKRFSNTLGQDVYYYSVRLTDGSVLRVSKPVNSVLGMFSEALPSAVCVVLIIIIIGYLLAERLTRRIVSPINSVDLNDSLNVPYDELTPFALAIEKQRLHIAQQLSDLQNRADTISAIMDNMRESIIMVDERGVILSVNKSAAAFLEAGNSIDGHNILEVIRDVDLLENVRKALSGSRAEMNMVYLGRTYHVFFSPVTGNGAIILFLDITEKTLAENSRREFSANVSHELKTPLTSIYGHAEMLMSGMVKESDMREFFGKIKHEAERLITLIEDIILISKLDEGKGYETFESVDIASVAAETVDALSLKADENNVSVHVSGKDVFMAADRSMIYEMFYNLIDNAIKYNKPGGTVEVDIAKTGEQVKISVADTGMGIPKEAQDRVFERFYRVEKSRSKKTGGTGLGLAIVKHIVMIHGGKVTLKSGENEGTTITLVF
jgi:two-component system phosphate regulon sensor histidine kinase PhoR